MGQKILVLEDRYAQKDRLINLGDRALSVGVRQLLEEYMSVDITQGVTKPFPYLNEKAYRKLHENLNVEEVLEKWFEDILSSARHKSKFESYLVRFLDRSFIFNNRLFLSIDQWVKNRFTIGLVEWVKPYLCRNYFAKKMTDDISSSEIVIFSAAGLIAEHLSRFIPMYMFEVYLAVRLGKPVAVINQSVFVKDEALQELISCVYSMVNVHTVREPQSASNLEYLGVKQENIIVSYDSAFFVKGSSRKDLIEKEGISKGDIAIAIRGDRSLKELKYLINSLSKFSQETGHQIYFIYTCYAHDKKLFNELSKHISIRSPSEYYNYDDVIELLRGFDLLITDRYHAAIFAMIAGTPVLAIDSITKKLGSLMEAIKYPLKTIQSNEIKNNLYPQIKRVVNERDELSDFVSARVHEARKNVSSSIISLKDFI
jgi:polysaccharide pyruvyl transferase WcaK-like protein